jgi:predicted RNase H-like nuclease (RuvC/YqgF family)
MSQFDLLQPRREALQEQYSLLSEKLLELRRNAAFANDPGTKFQLKNQIAETEKELEELAQRQDELDRVSQDGRLYQALLKLGYLRSCTSLNRELQNG